MCHVAAAATMTKCLFSVAAHPQPSLRLHHADTYSAGMSYNSPVTHNLHSAERIGEDLQNNESLRWRYVPFYAYRL